MTDTFSEEFQSSLNDLVQNSKPMINCLTMLADDNRKKAPQVVQIIEAHLQKVRPEHKMHTIFLLDSIVKNVREPYLRLFTQNIVSTFCGMFEKVDEKSRASMYRLRQTWADVFPPKKLYAIDTRVKLVDPAWPVTAPPPDLTGPASIHVNPKFLQNPPTSKPIIAPAGKTVIDVSKSTSRTVVPPASESELAKAEADMKRQLLIKKQELAKLQKQRMELELQTAQHKLEEEKRQIQLKEQELEEQRRKALIQQQKQRSNTTGVRILTARPPPPDKPNAQSDASVAVVPKTTKDPRLMKATFVPTIVTASVTATNLNTLSPSVRERSGSKSPLLKATSDVTKLADSKPVAQLDPRQLPRIPKKVCVTKADVLPEAALLFDRMVGNDVDSEAAAARADLLKKTATVRQHSILIRTPEKVAAAQVTKTSPAKPKVDSPKKSSLTSLTPEERNAAREAIKAQVKERLVNKRKENRMKIALELKNKVDEIKFKKQIPPRPYRQHTESESPTPDNDGEQPSTEEDHDYRIIPQRNDLVAQAKAAIAGGQPPPGVTVSGPTAIPSSSSEKTLARDSDETQALLNDLFESSESEPEQESMAAKPKESEPDVDNLFGAQDQDYRLPPPTALSPIPAAGWAQFKATTPQLELPPPFPAPAQLRGPTQFDYDMRVQSMMRPSIPMVRPIRREIFSSNERFKVFRGAVSPWDPRIVKGFDDQGMPIFSGSEPNPTPNELLPQEPQADRTLALLIDNANDQELNIPSSLRLNQRTEILTQADEKLRLGEITPEQHRELLEGLGKLFELQQERCFQRAQVLGSTPWQQRSPEPMLFENSSRSNEQPPEEQGQKKMAVKRKKVRKPVKSNKRPTKETRRILIDNQSVEVRFVNKMALLMMKGNSPHEIKFRGKPKKVLINGRPVMLGFDGDCQRFCLPTGDHTIQFGAPSREIYIDDDPYEAMFNGEPFEVVLDGRKVVIKIDPPAPEVYVDPYEYVPPLPDMGESADDEDSGSREGFREQKQDTTPSVPIDQRAESDNVIRSTMERMRNEERVLRRSPGKDSILRIPRFQQRRDEEMQNSPLMLAEQQQTQEPSMWSGSRNRGRRTGGEGGRRPRSIFDLNVHIPVVRIKEVGPPPPDEVSLGPPTANYQEFRGGRGRREREQQPLRQSYQFASGNMNFGPGDFDQGLPPPRMRMGMPGMAGGPINPNLLPLGHRPRFMNNGGPMRNFQRGPLLERPPGYRNAPPMMPPPMPPHMMMDNGNPSRYRMMPPGQQMFPPMPVLPNINVNDLFSKLVSAGIVPTSTASDKKQEEEENLSVRQRRNSGDRKRQSVSQPVLEIPPIDLDNLDQIKTKFPAVYTDLYRGIQCSSCGIRFTAELVEKYSYHLDWHFRQNRREKETANKALSRKWFYSIQDWIQFEEMENEEGVDRTRSFFVGQNTTTEPESNGDTRPVVSASLNENDNICCVCREAFEQNWDEEREEWVLKDALREEGKTYHPLCFEDLQSNSGLAETSMSISEPSVEAPKAEDKVFDPLSVKIKPEPVDHEVDQTENPSVSDGQPVEAAVVFETAREAAVESTGASPVFIKAEPVDIVMDVEEYATMHEVVAEGVAAATVKMEFLVNAVEDIEMGVFQMPSPVEDQSRKETQDSSMEVDKALDSSADLFPEVQPMIVDENDSFGAHRDPVVTSSQDTVYDSAESMTTTESQPMLHTGTTVTGSFLNTFDELELCIQPQESEVPTDDVPQSPSKREETAITAKDEPKEPEEHDESGLLGSTDEDALEGESRAPVEQDENSIHETAVLLTPDVGGVTEPLLMPVPGPSRGITINLSSAVQPATVAKQISASESESECDDLPVRSQTAHLKPHLKTRKFTVLPPVNKDRDMSGLCSIM